MSEQETAITEQKPITSSLTITIKALNTFIGNALIFYWAIHFNAIEFSGTQIGLLFGLNSVTSLISAIPSGISNDLFRSKRLILLGLLFDIIALYGISQMTAFIYILPLFILAGIGNSLVVISLDSLIYKTSRLNHTERPLGNYVAMGFVAGAFGIVLAGFLLDVITFPTLLLLLCGLLLLLMVISLFLPDIPTARQSLQFYRHDLKQPKIVLLIALIFFFAIHYGAEHTSYTLFLKNNLGLNFPQMGIYMSVCILNMALVVLYLRKKINEGLALKKILIAGLVISGLGHIAMTYPFVIPSFIGRFVHEIGDASLIIFLYTAVSRLFPTDRLGGNAGIFVFTQVAGAFVSSLIFGHVGEMYGYSWPFIITGGITLGAAGVAYKYRHLVNY